MPAGTYTTRPARRVFAARGHRGRATTATARDARRSRSPSRSATPTCSSGSAIGPILESLARAPVQERRADRQLAAQRALPGSEAGRRPIRASAAARSSTRAASAGVLDLGAIDVQRGRDHGMPTLQRPRAAYGLAPATLVHRHHRRADRRVPERPQIDRTTRSTTRTSSTSSACGTRDGNAVRSAARRRRRTRSTGTRRTTLAARLRAIYGDVDSGRRVRGHGRPSRTSGAPSSASCSSRSGRGSSRACATATASST